MSVRSLRERLRKPGWNVIDGGEMLVGEPLNTYSWRNGISNSDAVHLRGRAATATR